MGITVKKKTWNGFIASKTLNFLVFQSFDFVRTWLRLFQKRVMCTKFDNYVFVESFVNIKNIKNGLKYFNATFLHENDLHYVKKFAGVIRKHL